LLEFSEKLSDFVVFSTHFNQSGTLQEFEFITLFSGESGSKLSFFSSSTSHKISSFS
jgi:hypothetical protein